MLPGFLGTGKMDRSDAIGNLLSSGEYDVLVFQEAFYAPARNKIRKQLRNAYPFEAGPANAKGFSFRTNSGLWICSKYPIVKQEEIVFETRYGIDAMSRKGGLLVELDVQGYHIQVVATHLQNAGKSVLKHDQCEELYTKLLQQCQRPGIPQIVCGDFNVDRHSASDAYSQMLVTLNATDAAIAGESFSYDRQTNDLRVEPGNARELIDYIFVRDNASALKRLHYAVRIFSHPWHRKHNHLSDHYAIETELEIGSDPVLPTVVANPVAFEEPLVQTVSNK